MCLIFVLFSLLFFNCNCLTATPTCTTYHHHYTAPPLLIIIIIEKTAPTLKTKQKNIKQNPANRQTNILSAKLIHLLNTAAAATAPPQSKQAERVTFLSMINTLFLVLRYFLVLRFSLKKTKKVYVCFFYFWCVFPV